GAHPTAPRGLRVRVPVRSAAARAAGRGECGAAAAVGRHTSPGGRRHRASRSGAARAGRDDRTPARRAVRWAGAAGRHRPGARRFPGRDLRRRADRGPGQQHRHRGDAAAGGGRGRPPRLVGGRHPRPAGGIRLLPDDHAPRRPDHLRPGLCGGSGSVTAALRLWWLLGRRERSTDQLPTMLAVTAFAVASGALLVVLGGLHAMVGRWRSGLEPDTGQRYLVLAVTAAGLMAIPILTLGGQAARLTLARRDRRLAALRLAGATSGQTAVLTVAETTAQAA